MSKPIVLIFILILLISIGLESGAATSDTILPGSQAVMKPPDSGVSPPYSLPSIVIPVTPKSTLQGDGPVSGIVQSPVLSGIISSKVEPEQLLPSTNTTQNSSVCAQAYIPDRVIVKFKTDHLSPVSSVNQIQAEAHAAMGATVLADISTLGVEGMQVVSVPNTTGTMKAIELYRMNPLVEYAQPDYLYSINSTIIDPPVSVNQQTVPYPETIQVKPSSVQVPNVPPPSSPPSCPTCLSSGSQSGVVGFEDPLSEEERYNAAQAEVDEINAHVKEHNLSWTAAVNPIMLMSPEEREHLKGLRHDLKSSTIVNGAGITPMEGLPTSFDWRNNGGDYTTPIKNQGSCGSCWAFATTGAFESYKEIKSGNPGMNPDYAEQYLVNCAGDQRGCNGGLFTAMAYFVNKAGLSGGVGTVTEANYPYTGSDGTCKSLSGYTRYLVDTAAGETWGYVGGGDEWSIPSDDAIKTAIYLYGPVAAGVYAESTFDSYRSGILDSTSSASYANHAIIIVGWGTLNGRTYWICKNSWGTSWGESGWFRIYSGRLRIGEGAAYFKYTASNPSGGTIAFNSNPSGAQIWIDGVNTGQVTPYTQTSVPIGTYSVTLKLSGYQEYTRSVSVTSGQTTVISATLSPIPTGSIAVSSTPSGARIWLDGVDTTKSTPATLSSVPIGSHAVSLVLSGYNSYSTVVMVHEGQTSIVSGTLNQINPGTQVLPNDPSFSSLWGLHNTGQSGGTGDADIDAPEAWSITTGSPGVIVAVVDTGVDYNHPDLVANIWRDPVTNTPGYDFYGSNDPNPMDEHGHGTHCAGTIGAVGNNGIGVTGVNWNVKIMPLRFLGADGYGSTSDAIEAFAWGYAKGARIFSNSWGAYGIDYALRDSINLYPDALFVCAAGNGDIYGNPYNTDSYPHSPSSLANVNILSVTATNRYDQRASWANYGATTVDVAAPGVSIMSTTKGNSYGTMSGTSMATPHVAGVAALIKAQNPSYSASQIKSAIMNNVDLKSGLSGRCVTGGRINAFASLASSLPLKAKFYGVPDTTIKPLRIRFYDVSEGIISSRLWNFGDGNTTGEVNPSHTYYNPGIYTVTLQVNDGVGTHASVLEIQGG